MSCDGDGCNCERGCDELENLIKEAELRKVRAEAGKAEIELLKMEDEERDRMVKVGRIRHLYINDVIDGARTDRWLEVLQHWERRDPGEPVTIDINSPGGSITDGLALYDQIARMRRKGHHVTTRAVGGAFSMGTVILQAGDHRIMDKRAKLLIHEGSSFRQGSMTVAEEEDSRAFRNKLLDDILTILADRSTLTKRQIANRWKRKDWYLDADEALKLGFVDAVE